MIVVTHELEFARKVANRVILMEHGKIIEENTAEGFFSHPKEERTREFIRNAMDWNTDVSGTRDETAYIDKKIIRIHEGGMRNVSD